MTFSLKPRIGLLCYCQESSTKVKGENGDDRNTPVDRVVS